jgi:trimeric autotransporter adhesin
MKTAIPQFVIVIQIVCLASLQHALAISPPPDGGYPGGNTAEGQNALLSRTTGGYNTAVGYLSLLSDTTGSYNTALGAGALLSNTGGQNTAIGAAALLSNSSGNNNIAIGSFAGSGVTTANNVICIGAAGADTSNSCYIGNIFGHAVGGDGLFVFVDSSGNLGTAGSSRRFKHDIKPMDKASEAILALKPVTFHYKTDSKNTPCYGLIAEEVAKVSPDLVVRDKNGDLLTVRYEQVNAMLLNEFLKEHSRVQELEATVAQQHKQIEVLAAGLEKVSAQLATASPSTGGFELSKSAPQMVLNAQ